MNHRTILFAVPILLVVYAALGCGDVNSTFTGNIDGTCYLSVNNQSLDAVVKTFAENMGLTVVLAEGVDGVREVSTTIKADSWEQGLESLASDCDLRVEHDEMSNTYTLAPQ